MFVIEIFLIFSWILINFKSIDIFIIQWDNIVPKPTLVKKKILKFVVELNHTCYSEAGHGTLKVVVLTFNECHLRVQGIPVVNVVNNMKRSIIYNSKKSVLMYWNLGSSPLGRLWLFPNHKYLWYLKWSLYCYFKTIYINLWVM